MPRQLGAEDPGALAPAGPQAPPTMEGLLPQSQQTPEQGGPQAQPTSVEDHVEALLQQFRDLSTQVQALARQYPSAQQDLAIANDALINAMSKVVSGLSAESSSAPPSLM